MKILITGGSGFIGTNIHEYLSENFPDIRIVNVDIVKPKIEFKNSVWEKCDILNLSVLERVFEEHKPDGVIHLAAETSCEPHLTMENYKVNIMGSSNVFETASSEQRTKFLIHTSTQFVNQFDFPLTDFYNYNPHTVYGESKIESEKLLTQNEYRFNWVIIRPTNIWGKWHLRYPTEFWKVLHEGKYIHPNKKGIIRSYGYVKNICNQIMHFVENIERLDKEIFYVGDEPLLLYDWVNEFSKELCGRKVNTVNKNLIFLMALFGDILSKLKIRFPITTSRYKSMTTSNPAPMHKTIKEIGFKNIDWKEGVRETAEWLKSDVYK